MPDQPAQNDRSDLPEPLVAATDPTRATGDPAPLEAPGASASVADEDDPDAKDFTLNFSFGSTKPIPLGELPPDLVERLRSGTPPSAQDLAAIRSASGGAGMAGMLMEAMSAAGFGRLEDVDPADTPLPEELAELAGDPNVVIVPERAQKFEWTWGGGVDPGAETRSQPATYYEALTGTPDPMRGFFISARRTLNIVTWILAIGLPVGLILLTILTGQSSETIFFAGFGGLVVGLMIRSSLSRTPFG